MRSASSVSAVSPDWDRVTNNVPGGTTTLPVAVFAGNFDLQGTPANASIQYFPTRAGVVTGAAGNDVQVLDARQQFGGSRPERFGHDEVVVDPAVQRIGKRARLFEDFLEHEVAVRALFRGVVAPLRLVHFAGHGLARRIENAYFLTGDFCEVTLLEINKTLGYRQQGRHAARHKVLADAKTDNEGARNAADHDALRILGIEYQKCIRAFEPLHGQAHRLHKVVAIFQIIVNEMRSNFGVGLRFELVTLGQHLFFDGLKVFDDAVVDDGDAITGQMRVGVGFGDTTVGGPTRMGNPKMSAKGFLSEFFLELRDFANGAASPSESSGCTTATPAES